MTDDLPAEKAAAPGSPLWPDAYCPTSERDDAITLYNEAEKQRREQVASLRALCDKQEKELRELEKLCQAQRECAATHRCKVCGALWICSSDSWSLASQECGQCCDNQPMDAQIEAVGMTKELDERWKRLYEKSDRETSKWYQRAMLLRAALKEWQRVWKETECEYDDCHSAWENAEKALASLDAKTERENNKALPEGGANQL